MKTNRRRRYRMRKAALKAYSGANRVQLRSLLLALVFADTPSSRQWGHVYNTNL